MLLGLLTFCQPLTQAWHGDGSGDWRKEFWADLGEGHQLHLDLPSLSGLQSRLFCPLPVAGVDYGEEKLIPSSIYLFFSEHL